MDHILNFFQSLFPTIVQYKYIFIFLGATIEGMNTIIVGGFLSSINKINLIAVFLLCVAGQVINGYIWYIIGYFAGAKPLDKWGRKDPKSKKIIEKVEQYFNKYSGRAILIAKLTWSLTIATLIMAGSFKYNFRKFGWYNLIGSVGWVVLLFFVGFIFGEGYKIVFVYLKGIVYLFLFLGGAVALIYILQWFLKTTFIQSLFISEKIREFSEKIKNGLDNFLSDR